MTYNVKYYGHYRWTYEQGLMHGYQEWHNDSRQLLSFVCSI